MRVEYEHEISLNEADQMKRVPDSTRLGDPAKIYELLQKGNPRIWALMFDFQRPDPTMVPKRRVHV